MTHTTHLFFSCEHAGNLIPPAWRGLFARYSAMLMSHWGFDAGALTLARELAHALGAELFYSKTSRLLVDLNRSPGHPQLFSAITRKLAAAQRQQIISQHYRPYRSQIETHIREQRASGRHILHIAIHSFTPELKGRVRNIDVGLLYDPARPGESSLAQAWQAALSTEMPGLNIRRNAPYKGTSDGLTAALRKLFGPEDYTGIELEVNQKHVFARNRHWPKLRHAITRALVSALREAAPPDSGGQHADPAADRLSRHRTQPGDRSRGSGKN